MSRPASQPPASASLTRQQLDELDQLLQRMLQLPVNHLDEPPGRGAPPPAAAASAPAREAGPAPPASEKPTPAVSMPPVRPAPPPAPMRPPLGPAPSPPPAPVAWWLRALYRSNDLFDRAAGQLGAPGRWLCRPAGRAVLGWTGVAFLAAAGVLAVLGLAR
jgi:hypothetical protein